MYVGAYWINGKCRLELDASSERALARCEITPLGQGQTTWKPRPLLSFLRLNAGDVKRSNGVSMNGSDLLLKHHLDVAKKSVDGTFFCGRTP